MHMKSTHITKQYIIWNVVVGIWVRVKKIQQVSCDTSLLFDIVLDINSWQESVKNVLRAYFLKVLHGLKVTIVAKKKKSASKKKVQITVIFTLLLFCEENNSVVHSQ